MVYLATERVEPLHNQLTRKSNTNKESKKELYFSWGIFQITVCNKAKKIILHFVKHIL